jgi:aconitate hydratase
VAGPRRPQDRVRSTASATLPDDFPTGSASTRPARGRRRTARRGGVARVVPGQRPPSFAPRDARAPPADPAPTAPPVDGRSYRPIEVEVDGQRATIWTGSVAIAAITVVHEHLEPDRDDRRRAAGPERGRPRPARRADRQDVARPGSKAVTGYLEAAGLMAPLETLGFALAGYGCTTCIGNSGPLDAPIAQAVESNDLVVAAVLSGNRNFEGRIHPLARASYLASPPLVVAFASAGRVDIDMLTEPLGTGSDGTPVFLADIWPEPAEIRAGDRRVDRPRAVPPDLRGRLRGRRALATLPIPDGDRYAWDEASTYIAKPPFFDGLTLEAERPGDIEGARVLALLGDSGHDRPHLAGRLDRASAPAGTWLQEHGVAPLEFNSYGRGAATTR